MAKSSGTGNYQDLQEVTLGKIHPPLRNKACQELLRMPGIEHKGWLRRKKPWKILGSLGVLLQSIAWDRKFVVIHNGCMYFYNNESDKKPDKAISLFGYTRVMRAGEIHSGREVLWPFKVAYVLDQKDRVHYFSASCEEEMMTWLKRIKLELYKANGVEYSDDCTTHEDIHDLETPISTGNYFEKITDLKKIKEAVRVEADDFDMDDEYDYIEPLNAHSVSALIAKPSFAKVPAPPKKPGRAYLQNAESPVTSTPSPLPSSTGYYPPLLKSDTTASSSKPLPLKKKPVKPIHSQSPSSSKVPPATPQKPKPQVKRRSSDDNSEATPIWKNSLEGSLNSSSSVANLRQALLSGQAANTAKPSLPSKPSFESSPASNSKPFSPLPSSTKKSSKTPTAVIFPIRQSNQRSRFMRDLEADAMWTQNPGDGQRLLSGSRRSLHASAMH